MLVLPFSKILIRFAKRVYKGSLFSFNSHTFPLALRLLKKKKKSEIHQGTRVKSETTQEKSLFKTLAKKRYPV